MNKSLMLKNYGHNCTVPTKNLEETFAIRYSTSRNIFSKICGFFRQFLFIDDSNMQVSKYCRSEYSIYMERKKQLKRAPNIIHPLSPFRKWWEIFMIMVFVIVSTFIPFVTAFSLLPQISSVHLWQDFPRILLDIFCILDIFIHFRTGFYDDQLKINLKTKDIAKNYFKRTFVIDLVSSIPPLYLTPKIKIYNGSHLLLYTNLIISGSKSLRVYSCLHYIYNYSKMKNYRHYNTKIFLITITILFVFHWITCLCIVVSVLSVSLYFSDIPKTRSWITHNGIWNSSTERLYITAVFRTSSLVSNAEYDLMSDATVADEVLVCILWTVSRIMFVAFVSLLVQITRSLTSSQTKYKEMVIQLMQYMNHKQLSTYTQNRLISYYEFRFQKSFFREEEILNTISVQLRQEILMLKCLKLVENVPFFQGLPQSLLMRIVLSLELEIFLINDVIIKAMSKGTSMYFIGSGTVAVYTPSGKEVYHLHDGQHFGEVEIVMPEMPRIGTVTALEPCETFRFDRKDFLQIIRPYPELLVTMEQLATEKIQIISAVEEKYKHFNREKRSNRLNMV